MCLFMYHNKYYFCIFSFFKGNLYIEGNMNMTMHEKRVEQNGSNY